MRHAHFHVSEIAAVKALLDAHFLAVAVAARVKPA